jgi:hypothetical protein
MTRFGPDTRPFRHDRGADVVDSQNLQIVIEVVEAAPLTRGLSPSSRRRPQPLPPPLPTMLRHERTRRESSPLGYRPSAFDGRRNWRSAAVAASAGRSPTDAALARLVAGEELSSHRFAAFTQMGSPRPKPVLLAPRWLNGRNRSSCFPEEGRRTRLRPRAERLVVELPRRFTVEPRRVNFRALCTKFAIAATRVCRSAARVKAHVRERELGANSTAASSERARHLRCRRVSRSLSECF